MAAWTGWTIIHRTLARYELGFPGYTQRIQEALIQEFPGAAVVSELYQQNAEEPSVVPPAGTADEAISEARAKARIAHDRAALGVNVASPQSPNGTTSTEAVSSAVPSVVESTSVKAEDTPGTWIVIVPMFQLEISDDAPINGRWNVGNVSFVSRAQLAAILTPPTLTNIPSPVVWGRITADDNTFAIITLTGVPKQLRHTVFGQLREATSVLASTAAFYGKRHNVSGFTLKGYPAFSAKHDRFIQTDGTAFCGNWNQRGFLHSFVLDADWHRAITQTGIIDLFARINDNTLDAGWRRQIRSGAAMLGRSLMSLDLADAFLLDVIGLETLLTRPRERNGQRLFQRIKGMTGWHLKTARPDYEDEITDIHGVRCDIVHDSEYSNLTIELLLQADMYLANSLLNIVTLPAIFPDKTTLATTLDAYAVNENWPTDGSVPFRWFGNSTFSQADLDLPLW